jgi:SAM-dependent methyltransferase
VDEHQGANRAWWDEVVAAHLDSELYDIESFKAGRLSMQQLERDDLGDVAGKTLLHLQCHFGQDTLSWARLGATVTGLDFAESAIEAARALADEIGVEATFVCANVYDAREALEGRQFDVVYTGGGALVWLPDLARWAEVAAACVRPGGVLYVREFHPYSHIFDDEADDGLRIRYPYFASREPLRFDDGDSYAAADAATEHTTTYEWSHPLSEVVTAIAATGLRIEFLHEVDYTEFRQLPFMVQGDDRRWRLPEHAESVPLQYSLRARKPA